jgi:replicative DNA helicase
MATTNRIVKPNRGIDIAPPLPYSADAESSILGAILLDNGAFEEVSALKPEEFFLQPNRLVFSAMLAMREADKPIDLVTLCEKLEAQGSIERVGGAGYVSRLIDGVPHITNVAHYVLSLKKTAALRSLISLGEHFQQKAFDTGAREEAFSLLDEAAQALQDLVVEYATPKTLGKTSRQAALELLKSFGETGSLLRINVGIPELDKATGGFRSRELITITAGVTGSGKTLFAQQIKRSACKEGKHGLYFSGEMSSEQLAAREIATEAGVPHWKIRRPEKLSEEEYRALFSNAAKDCEICRTIDGELSIKDIRVACQKQKREGKLSWIVIDYDELVDAPGKDEFAQQRNVIREAKRISILCEIPVFVISGLRKPLDKNEAKKPTLERIYGSGAKSKHSSFVLFVDREYVRELKGDETKARICILKARDGKIGEIPATFNLQTLRFQEETAEEEILRKIKKKKASDRSAQVEQDEA